MKTDTDQLIGLLKTVRTYRLKDLCGTLPYSVGSDDGVALIKRIARCSLNVPKGTVLKIAELEQLLKQNTILVFAVGGQIGNVVVVVDHNTLDVEKVMYSGTPTRMDVVRSISIPPINTSQIQHAIMLITRNYKDRVTKMNLGLLPKSLAQQTLITDIFEYSLTGQIPTGCEFRGME